MRRTGSITLEGKIYVPAACRSEVLRQYHELPIAATRAVADIGNWYNVTSDGRGWQRTWGNMYAHVIMPADQKVPCKATGGA